MDQAGGGHAVVSSPPLSICTKILTVNVKRSGVKFFFIRVTPKIYIYIYINSSFFLTPQIGFNLLYHSVNLGGKFPSKFNY